MISRWQRYLHEHPRATSVLAAMALAGISLPGAVLSIRGATVPPRLPGLLLTVLACAALPWHRARPRFMAVVVIACTIAVTALGYTVTPLLLAPAIAALFALALHARQRTANALTAIAITGVVSAALAADPPTESLALKVFGPAAWLLLGPSLGAAARLRQAVLQAAQARADHAEQTREEEARRRVGEERIRIARDLHDVVAHHLALAHAQAGAIAHLIRANPAQARELASSLAGTTSSALRELKATVGLLRQDGDPEAPLEPAPGLARLRDLVASFAAAGLPVTVTADGESRPLPPAVDLTAFRIIAEALTNAAKHAPGCRALVRLGYGADLLSVTIVNDDGGPVRRPPGTAGFGLIGMRERAQSVGGRITYGRRLDGGFEVTADLPVQPRDLAGSQAS